MSIKTYISTVKKILSKVDRRKQTSLKFTNTAFKCDSVPLSRCHILHPANSVTTVTRM